MVIYLVNVAKSNVAMNAWLPQASYPCCNISTTSCLKLSTSKRIDRPCFHGPYVYWKSESNELLSFCSMQGFRHHRAHLRTPALPFDLMQLFEVFAAWLVYTCSTLSVTVSTAISIVRYTVWFFDWSDQHTKHNEQRYYDFLFHRKQLHQREPCHDQIVLCLPMAQSLILTGMTVTRVGQTIYCTS